VAIPPTASPIDQAVLNLIDAASPNIEAALTAYIKAGLDESVCPAHPYTTVGAAGCAMCELDEQGHATFPAPAASGWVARALTGQLPAKRLR
jgi:hypothetical protein